MADTTLPGVLLKGVAASRPAASAVAKGTIYSATDTGAISQSDASSWSTFATIGSGLVDPTTTRGDMLFRNSGGSIARLPLGAANTLLHGSATDPAYSAVLPADLDVSADNTTANATTGHHGFLPKLDSSASKYLDGSGAWSTPGGSSATGFEEVLGADVTLTTAGTYYDGPSHSCAAGTWLFWWKACFRQASSLLTDFVGRLWDGSATPYDESPMLAAALATVEVTVGGFAYVVLGGTTTVKISGTADRNSETMARDSSTSSGSSHTATKLMGLKIA